MRKAQAWVPDATKNAIESIRTCGISGTKPTESTFIQMCINNTLIEMGIPFNEDGNIDEERLKKLGGIKKLMRENLPKLQHKILNELDKFTQGKSSCINI